MTTQRVPPALVAWASLPGPAKVLAAARDRLEAGHGMTRGPLRVQLTPAEREQVGQLLGVTWAVSGRAVSAKSLVDAVTAAGGELVALLADLGGPLRDRPAERASMRQAADAERRDAHQMLVDASVPSATASAWLARRGLPRPGSGRLRQLAAQAAAVWGLLPTGDTMSLAVLATKALHDPHALDRGSPLATAVLHLLLGGDGDLPSDAASWRQAWEEHGVICDPLSSRVLVLNLALAGDAPACRLTSAAGPEPVWLTWRSLLGEVTTRDPEVHVCENPTVVAAAADELGARSKPLVCTNGRPSGATRRLLAGLAAAGAQILVRADDDRAGQEIVAGLLGLLPGAKLWRYTPRPASEAAATPRFEEQDLDLLLADLTRPPPLA